MYSLASNSPNCKSDPKYGPLGSPTPTYLHTLTRNAPNSPPPGHPWPEPVCWDVGSVVRDSPRPPHA
jgi:hypothetical protein